MLKIIVTDEINFVQKNVLCTFNDYKNSILYVNYGSNILIKTNQVLINNKPYLSK